ncbi:MAG: hypothetical protein ACHQ4H_18975, partial [Ktedonobacterales bacterium]
TQRGNTGQSRAMPHHTEWPGASGGGLTAQPRMRPTTPGWTGSQHIVPPHVTNGPGFPTQSTNAGRRVFGAFGGEERSLPPTSSAPEQQQSSLHGAPSAPDTGRAPGADRLNALGLPDLAGDDQLPNWHEDEP